MYVAELLAESGHWSSSPYVILLRAFGATEEEAQRALNERLTAMEGTTADSLLAKQRAAIEGNGRTVQEIIRKVAPRPTAHDAQSAAREAAFRADETGNLVFTSGDMLAAYRAWEAAWRYASADDTPTSGVSEHYLSALQNTFTEEWDRICQSRRAWRTEHST